MNIPNENKVNKENKEKRIIPLKLVEKYKRRKERKLLNQIQNLSKELIIIIYYYLTEKIKYIYNVKYSYLEEKIKIKEDSKKGFVFFKYLRNIFEPMENKQIIVYIESFILPFHPLIIENIWYTSKENNQLFTGMNLLSFWKKDGIDVIYYKGERELFNNMMKYRLVDAIYYYILKIINKYEIKKKQYLKSIYCCDDKVTNIPNEIPKIHSLYKSFAFLIKQ